MIKKLKNQVQIILQEYPQTRNSDIALMIEVWKRFYPNIVRTGLIGDHILLKDLYELPREDNVKRIRANFCEEGFSWAYPTDIRIAKARKINEEKWRIHLGYMPPIKNRFFEISGGVVKSVPENEVEKFLEFNPNAREL